MEVVLKSKNKRVLKPVDKMHYWYDTKTKKMWHGRGGEMYFVYDTKQKRSLPRLREIKHWTQRNDFDDIQKWVKECPFPVVDKTPGISITIDVPKAFLSDVEDELYRKRISCDYVEDKE